MKNLDNYIYISIQELEYQILLSTNDVEIYSQPKSFSFYAWNNAHIIINSVDYGGGLIIIDKQSGEITTDGCFKPVDVSSRLVNEFISQNADLQQEICEYLKSNPHDLFHRYHNSKMSVFPEKWVNVSNCLKGSSAKNMEMLPVIAGGWLGVGLGEKLVEFIKK